MPTFRNLTSYADAVPGSADRLLFETSTGQPRGVAPADLPGGSPGGFGATTPFGAGRTGEVDRALEDRIQEIINVQDFGVFGDGSTNVRSPLNTLITNCNALANPQRTILYFPPGDYMVNGGPLTTASGAYSIVMDAGACIFYTSLAGNHNQPMWQIGSAAAQNDGEGIRRFQLAAEVTGTGGANYGTPPASGNVNNVAFEIVNIKHCRIYVMRANEFHTGLRLTADGENPASPGTIIGDRHMFDVVVELGYLHSCVHSLVQRVRYNAWMNNITYRNGNFTQATNFQCRYINLICEGTFGTTPRGGENKAVFYDPLCDGTDISVALTFLYVKSSSAMVYGGHSEDPTWLIQHEDETGVPAGGDPSVWIAARLEGRQFQISDPDDVGSYAYDPFWGPGPTPRPLAITGNRPLTTGDVRAGRWLYNNSTTNRQITIPDFGSANQEPPVMAMVHFQQRDTGTIELLDPGAGVEFMIPTGKLARTRTRGSVMTAQLISLNGENVPATFGANQVWSVFGDLADAAGADLINVRDYGAVGDGATNDLAALNAAVTAAVAGNKRGVWLPWTTTGYAVNAVWAIPGTLDLIQDAPVIALGVGGTGITAIRIGAVDVLTFQRTYKLWAIRQQFSTNWSLDTDVGVDLINPNQCDIEIIEVSKFATGLRLHGLGSNGSAPVGAVWNHVKLRYFSENGCSVDLVADGAGGFCNQNIFYGGSFNCSTAAPNATQDNRGVRLRIANASPSLPNNNTFYSPAFELHTLNRTALTIPIDILNGRYNRFYHCRHETNDALFMRVAGNSWDNIAEIGYTEQTSAAGLLQDVTAGYNLVVPQPVMKRMMHANGSMPTLTYAGTISWDLYGLPTAKLTLTGAATINATDSSDLGDFTGRFTLVVYQDGVGSRVLTLGTNITAASPTAPLRTAAGSVTVLEFIGIGTGLVLAGLP